MRTHVVTSTPTVTLDAIARMMTNNHVGSVVIVDNGNPAGIVTTDDVVTAVAKGPSALKSIVKPLLSRPLITCSPDDDILKVTKLMIRESKKRIPVVRDGKLVGIVSDKEILLTAPEMIDVISEKLKARVERVHKSDDEISGVCEECEGYSDELISVGGKWLCEECRE